MLNDMTVAPSESSAAVLLARMDVRTDNMEKTLDRIEKSNSERFTHIEKEVAEQAQKIATLEAWKNQMIGAGIEEQPERTENLEKWRSKIVGMTFIAMPFVTILSGFAGAWLARHVP